MPAAAARPAQGEAGEAAAAGAGRDRLQRAPEEETRSFPFGWGFPFARRPCPFRKVCSSVVRQHAFDWNEKTWRSVTSAVQHRTGGQMWLMKAWLDAAKF